MLNKIKELQALAKNYKVLYVEDDLDIQRSMRDYLSKFFLEVVSASNGKEGLDAYSQGDFDLVVTDLSMPVMNGIEMIKAIKKIDAEQLVLVTSAHSESEYMSGAIEAGIDGYVIKPFNFEQLNKELFKVVEKLYKFAQNEKYKNDLEKLVENKTQMLSSLLKTQHDNYEKTIYSMVEMIEDRDTYTAGHSKRVAAYSELIARQMGFSEEDCVKIHQAGILHDVGKIATPDAVLLNPKKLNELEYKLIQEHVNVGYKLIKNVPMFEPLAEIILSHHERYDGAGYPRGLKGEEITPLAQIMIVADAFDAMTTNRIYKARKMVSEALEELEELKLKQFHPNVVDAAKIALKDIEVQEDISQLPTTDLEEERFAYFYKDSISEVYNKSYLDLLLSKNRYEKTYSHIYAFFLKDFSAYNKESGWSAGDKLLNTFATTLKKFFTNSLVFRVFGDDFVVLTRDEFSIEKLREDLDAIIKETNVECVLKEIDVSRVDISSSEEIESF